MRRFDQWTIGQFALVCFVIFCASVIIATRWGV